MSLTAFVLVVGTRPTNETGAIVDGRIVDFLTGLTGQPTLAHSLDDSQLWQSSVYPDESDAAVFRRREANHDQIIVFDGWIENRDEIVASLQHHGVVDASSDSEIVLAGYREWGQDVAHQLYGEYSFVVLDQNEGQVSPKLLAVRDKVGIRPLFYTQWKGGVAISNFPGALTVISANFLAMDWAAVAEYATYSEASPKRSLYRDVSRVPGGWLLLDRANGDGVAAQQYLGIWQRGVDREHGSPEEHFAAIVRKSVVAAAKTGRPLALQVSGGIDSSCICAIVANALDAGQLATTSAFAVNRVYTEFACDEATYVDELARVLPFPVLRMAVAYPQLNVLYSIVQRLRYVYRSFAGSAAFESYKVIRTRGGRVCLTGELGDLLFQPTPQALRSALLRPSEWRDLATYFALRWNGCGPGASFSGKTLRAVSELLPLRLCELLQGKWRRSQSAPNRLLSPNWPRSVEGNHALGATGPQRARTVAHMVVLSQNYVSTIEAMYAGGFVHGIELRHPLASARVIEAASTLPLASFDGFGLRNRRPLRDAASPRLPAKIYQRVGKAEFTSSVLPALLDRAKAHWGGSIPAWIRFTGSHAIKGNALNLGRVWELDAALSLSIWAEHTCEPICNSGHDTFDARVEI